MKTSVASIDVCEEKSVEHVVIIGLNGLLYSAMVSGKVLDNHVWTCKPVNVELSLLGHTWTLQGIDQKYLFIYYTADTTRDQVDGKYL